VPQEYDNLWWAIRRLKRYLGITAEVPDEGTLVSDEAFSAAWDNDLTHAASKNALYDYLSAAGIGDIDAHVADSTIHFHEDEIHHNHIQNIGVYPHSTIDSHIDDATIHFTEASIDHGSIAGLGDDDHSGHPWLTGRAGGQTLVGGTLTTQDLTLQDNAVDGNNVTVTEILAHLASMADPHDSIDNTPFGAGWDGITNQGASKDAIYDILVSIIALGHARDHTIDANDDHNAASDNTNFNASALAHGFCPKLSNVATQYLNGQGAWTTPPDTSGIDDIVEDTTPQLGGNLDVNGKSIVSVAAGVIAITPDTTGDVILDGLKWPQADGSSGQVLKTNGAAQLSWVDQTSIAGCVLKNDFNAKGDLLSASADNTPLILASNVTNGDVLTIDTTSATGLKWATPAAGGGAGSDTTAIHDNEASEISAIANKAAPIGADFLLIEDSEAVNVKKHILISALPAAAPADHAATHTNGGDDIQDATAAQKGLATAAQITKLDGIEALADVTDATNVNAAGAVMNSDLDGAGEILIGDGVGDPAVVVAFTSNLLKHEYGGLEADVSAYAGLVKITGGATSAATIGIADNNIVEIDDAAVADNDYAKFTANGVEGQTYAQVRTDLGIRTQHSKSVTIEEPTTALDFGLFFTNQDITITEMRCVLTGTSPDITWTVRHQHDDENNGGIGRVGTGHEVVTGGTQTTSTTTGSDVTDFDPGDPTIPADSFVWLETPTVAVTPTTFELTIFWTYDAGA